MKNKNEIRKEIKNLFSTIKLEIRKEQDVIILKKIENFLRENSVQKICIYENFSDEVDSSQIIILLENLGLEIYTLQCISETEMILVDSEYEVYDKRIDVFFIPGRAFTREGKRLGRGKGYYDRMLKQKIYSQSIKIGIGYDFQILEDIPTEKHDINMDFVISN